MLRTGYNRRGVPRRLPPSASDPSGRRRVPALFNCGSLRYSRCSREIVLAVERAAPRRMRPCDSAADDGATANRPRSAGRFTPPSHLYLPLSRVGPGYRGCCCRRTASCTQRRPTPPDARSDCHAASDRAACSPSVRRRRARFFLRKGRRRRAPSRSLARGRALARADGFSVSYRKRRLMG